MNVSRRRALGLLGSALALPYVIRSDEAFALPGLRRIGNPIRLGAGQPGGQLKVALSAFPDGDFIAAWVNFRSGFDVRAYIRYFNSDGGPLSPEIQMGGPTGLTDGISALDIVPIARLDGWALILFGAERNDAPFPSRYDIFGQRIAPDYSKVGDPIVVNTKVADRQGEAILATRLSNRNILSVWQDQGASLDSYDVRDRILGPGGNGLFPERIANAVLPGMQVPRAIAPLANANSLVSYSSLVGNQWKFFLQKLNPQGVRSGNPYLVKGPVNQPFGTVGLGTLNGARFNVVAAWYTENTEDSADQWTQVINENGVPGVKFKLDTFPTDVWLDNPPNPPNVAAALRAAGTAILIREVYGEAVGRSIIQALAANPSNGNLIAGPSTIFTSASGLHPTNEALIVLPSCISVAGFTNGDGNPLHSKAYLQRLDTHPYLCSN